MSKKVVVLCGVLIASSAWAGDRNPPAKPEVTHMNTVQQIQGFLAQNVILQGGCHLQAGLITLPGTKTRVLVTLQNTQTGFKKQITLRAANGTDPLSTLSRYPSWLSYRYQSLQSEASDRSGEDYFVFWIKMDRQKRVQHIEARLEREVQGQRQVREVLFACSGAN